MEMAAVKKTLFLTALLFLLISCSSIQPRKPQFAVVKMVQVIDKKNAAHVGIFIPQIKEKNVRYTFVKDETDIDNPPVIKITMKNADIANTPLPEDKKIKTNALYKITKHYTDIEETTQAYLNLHLTNDYPFEIVEKPFGYQVIIAKNKHPLEKFVESTKETEEKKEEGSKEEPEKLETFKEETPPQTEEPEKTTTTYKEPEPSTTVTQTTPSEIVSAEVEDGQKLVLKISQKIEQPTIHLEGREKYLLQLPNTKVDPSVIKNIQAFRSQYAHSIQKLKVESSENSVRIHFDVKSDVYPILKYNTDHVTIKFEVLTAPLDDFGSYINIKKGFSQKKITLNLKEIKAKDAFLLLASYVDGNFIIDDSLTERVHLYLKDVQWDSAFSILLQSQRLGFVRERDDVIRIAKLSTLVDEKILAKKAKDAYQSLVEKETAIFPLSFIEATELSGDIKDLLSPNGNMMIDKKTNALVVYDTPTNLEKVHKLVSLLDIKRPRIDFKAEFIEAPLNFHTTLNIENHADLESTLSQEASRDNIIRLSIPSVTTFDRKSATYSAELISEKQKIPLKLTLLPRMVDNNQIFIDLQFEKEQLNLKTQLIVENGKTILIGGLSTPEKEYLVILTPSINLI